MHAQSDNASVTSLTDVERVLRNATPENVLLEMLISIGLCNRERRTKMGYIQFVYLLSKSVYYRMALVKGDGAYTQQWNDFIASGGSKIAREWFKSDYEHDCFNDIVVLLRSFIYGTLLNPERYTPETCPLHNS